MMLVLVAMMPVGAEAMKIASVDMERLFKHYYRTAEAQLQSNLEQAQIQKRNQELLSQIRKLDGELSKMRKLLDDPTTSVSRKSEIYKSWQAKQNEGIALDRERREFLQRRSRALNEKMVQRIKGLMEEIRMLVVQDAKREDYDFVFDKSGLSSSRLPCLLICKDSTDITPRLLKNLNKEQPAKEKTGTEPPSQVGVSAR